MSNEYLVNDFTGQAPGNASAANSATSGSGFSNVVVGTGGAVGYADLGGGDMGLRITLGTGESYARWTATTPTRRAIIRRQIVMPSVPAAAVFLARIWADAVNLTGFAITSTGAFMLWQSSGYVAASAWSGAVAGGKYWVEVTHTAAETGADGVLAYRIYAADGTTLLHEWSGSHSLTGRPNIIRSSGATSGSGWTYDDTTKIEGLFTDFTAQWIGPTYGADSGDASHEREYYRNDFTGQPSGAAASAANSALSGSAFSNVVTGGGGTVKYESAGTDTIIRVTPGTGDTYCRYTAVGTFRRAVIRRQFVIPSLPSGATALMRIASASALIASLDVTSTGAVRITQGAAIGASEWVGLAAGSTYWIEFSVAMESAAGMADGVVGYRVYAANGTTLLKEWVSPPNRNITTAPSIIRHSAVTTSSGWAADDTTQIEALYTDRLALWIGKRPWLVEQTDVTITPPRIGTVHASLSDVSIAADSYQWTVGPGAPMTVANGPDLNVYATGADDPSTFTTTVIAKTATGDSEPMTITVTIEAIATYACVAGDWKPVSIDAAALIAKLM